MTTFDLSGDIAVVTGGSRGLGRAMSFAFAHHGATVVVASRKEDACRAAAAEITATTGQTALIVGAALYLASGASSFTTGSIVKVDGGMAYGAG